eukprot:2726616-Pyramimonas_sp.AAC.1
MSIPGDMSGKHTVLMSLRRIITFPEPEPVNTSSPVGPVVHGGSADDAEIVPMEVRSHEESLNWVTHAIAQGIARS